MAKKFQNHRGPSQRQLRVGEEIKHALSELFMREDFYDEKKRSISVIVTEVRISPDLHNATVYFIPLAGKNAESTVKSLHHNTPQLRKMLSGKVKMRHTPALYFKLDDSFEEAGKIESILKDPKVLQDIEPK